ncbi:MAG TPA: hypothetical protein PLT30_12165, partial [Deltaproteobacteria bacterium]|nr:hypothetical protein [Deltaproteobacteria bacterium]
MRWITFRYWYISNLLLLMSMLLPAFGIDRDGSNVDAAVRVPFPLSSRLPATTGWLYYGDHAVARLRRSATGSITPITNWPHYGDHVLAL